MKKEQILIPIYQEPAIREGDLPPFPVFNLDFIQSCRDGLKIKKGPVDIAKVYTSFSILHDCAIDNNELDKIPQLIDWKLGLQQAIVNQQLHESRRFDIAPPEGLYKHPCPECGATGERYLISKVRLIGDTCKTCAGKKFLKEVPCFNCKGTGRIKIDEKSLKVDTTCPSCNGEKIKKNVRCRDCAGVGFANRIVLAPPIISRTLCKNCKGAGIVVPKRLPAPMNPVISKEACDMLTQQ
jgi:hypothetical protein